jgi:F-type H+-transporting ATPase subunit b
VISSALAASTGNLSPAVFYLSPAFWVAISFIIFIAICAKPVWRFTTSALDKKIESIETSIEEATRLREEAQDLLASYKRKIADAEKEAEIIISQARDEATNLKDRMTANLGLTLERREKLAIDRISQAESEATKEVRILTANIALEATHQLLVGHIKDTKEDELIDAAVKNLPASLS